MTLDEAQNVALMGQVESWDGWGRAPMRMVPDAILRSARRFFSDCKPSERVQEQLAAIKLVLDDREARSPQQRLAL